jgi:hypothetical protein
MSFNTDDLFLVNRGGTSFKTEYITLQNSILSVIERNACHVGDTAPADPHEGDLWWNPDNEEFRVYVATETDGVITTLTVNRGGNGYTAKDVALVGGNGVDGKATLLVSSGVITGATVADGGHGYTAGDLVSIDPTEGFGNAILNVATVNSVPTGEWQLVNGKLTYPEAAITPTAFDLSQTPFFSCGAIDVPTPTNGVNGQSGLIRFTDTPTSLAAELILPSGFNITAACIVPFYVRAADEILLGNPVEVS